MHSVRLLRNTGMYELDGTVVSFQAEIQRRRCRLTEVAVFRSNKLSVQHELRSDRDSARIRPLEEVETESFPSYVETAHPAHEPPERRTWSLHFTTLNTTSPEPARSKNSWTFPTMTTTTTAGANIVPFEASKRQPIGIAGAHQS